MKPHPRLLGLACVGTLLLALLQAQDAPKPAGAPPASDPLQLSRPGPEHEALARYAGTWDLTVTLGSGARALRFTGTATNRMIVGGRFLQMDYSARGPAEATEGQFSLGFDARHHRFALVAMDSFGTYFVTSQGPRDPATGRLRLRGTDDDPVMKALGHAKEFVQVVDFKSQDELVVEVWFVDTRTAERREFKYMDYTFRRRG